MALEVTAPMFAEVRAKLVRADANVTTDRRHAGDQVEGRQVPTSDAGQSVAVLVSPEAA